MAWSTSNIRQNSCCRTKDKLNSPSCRVTAQSRAAHIDLHKLFTACQTLNISVTVKEVARGGLGYTEGERKIRVSRGLIRR